MTANANPASSAGAARAMLAPMKLKEFREDFEVARSSCVTANQYLEAEDEHAKSGAQMRRTSKAAMECGTALKRMHDSKSYLETYDNWTQLCRALPKMSRSNSYRLMSLAEKLSKVPLSSIGKVGTPLSVISADQDDEPDEPIVPINTPSSAPPASPFARLRETLQAAPAEVVDEAEAPKQGKVDHDAAWVKQRTTELARWFEKRDLAEDAAPHLQALVELAEGAPAA